MVEEHLKHTHENLNIKVNKTTSFKFERERATIRLGKFGPFIQLDGGEGKDNKRFIGLKPFLSVIKIDKLTEEHIKFLAQLPMEIANGNYVLRYGRFGLYITRVTNEKVSVSLKAPWVKKMWGSLSLGKIDCNAVEDLFKRERST